MTTSLRVAISGAPPAACLPGVNAAASASVVMSLSSTTGVGSVTWRIRSYPDGYNPGAPWYQVAGAWCAFGPVSASPAFVLPGSGFDSYLLEALSNDGQGGPTSSARGGVAVLGTGGVRLPAYGETDEFDSSRQWLSTLRASIIAQATGGGGGGGGGGGSSGGGSSLVLRPGGTAGGNVYTSEALHYAAFQASAGPQRLWMDTSSGTINFVGDRDYEGRTEIAAIPFTNVTTSAGVQLDNLTIIRGVNILGNTTTAPTLFALGAGTNNMLAILDGGSVQASSASYPAISAAGDCFIRLSNEGRFDGSNPVLDPNGHTVRIRLSDGSNLKANMLTGSTGIVEVIVGPGCTLNPTQTAYSGTIKVYGGFVGAYASNLTYMAGCIVTSGGSVFLALVNNATGTPTSGSTWAQLS